MLKPIPETIDVVQFAKGERVVEGEYAITSLTRLSEVVADTSTDVEFNVKFLLDLDRVVVLEGQINTTLSLVCQRCMEPFQLNIDHAFLLGAVEQVSMINRLPEGYDPLILDDKGSIQLRDVIEDEVILCLPTIAKHTTECIELNPTDLDEVKPEANENPFAVLKTLKSE